MQCSDADLLITTMTFLCLLSLTACMVVLLHKIWRL